MQLAAVTGVWGLSFLVAWFASVANWAWERGLAATSARTLVVSYATLVAVITLLGALRLALPAPSPTMIRAATVTSPAGLFTAREVFRIADGRLAVDATVAEKLARLHDWFFENTEREARAGARLVAWPEMGFLVRSEDEPAALERARGVAAREHIFLAMGIGAVQAGAPKPFQNKAVLIDPSGHVLYSYLKSRPVMGWEQGVMQVGDGLLPVVPTPLGRIATAICYDGDHPDLLRQTGMGRTDLSILPVNDWPEVKDSHFAMAAFRAVENGTPLLRPASGGVSGAFDAQGRVLARADHLRGAPTMAAEMPVGAVPTVYARVGDLFAWLCVAACGVAPFLVQRAALLGLEGRNEPVGAGPRFS
jgi:apolipoprotein N-acyltransferase